MNLTVALSMVMTVAISVAMSVAVTSYAGHIGSE